MSTMEEIESYVDAQSKAATRIDWSKVALNFITFPLIGLPISATDTAEQHKTPVSDEWLGQVAGLPRVSTRGLQHLSSKLTEKGWVSIAEAVRFVEIEKQEEAKQQDRALVNQRKANLGAALLLSRAESELPGTLEKFTNALSSIGLVASNAATIASAIASGTEKALSATAAWVKRT